MAKRGNLRIHQYHRLQHQHFQQFNLRVIHFDVIEIEDMRFINQFVCQFIHLFQFGKHALDDVAISLDPGKWKRCTICFFHSLS
jgi:hypothetical protein